MLIRNQLPREAKLVPAIQKQFSVETVNEYIATFNKNLAKFDFDRFDNTIEEVKNGPGGRA